jgi:hypothetical protein
LSAPADSRSGRLWSLWDIMIKFELCQLVTHLRLMQTAENRLSKSGLIQPEDYDEQQKL